MEKARGGRPEKTGITVIPVIAEPMTFKELGISKREASHAQKIASIPREKLRAHFEQVKESGGEITTNGVLRLASKTAHPKLTSSTREPV